MEAYNPDDSKYKDLWPVNPRNTFEYVYDDPETKILLEDENW
jgi:hypothetical protein